MVAVGVDGCRSGWIAVVLRATTEAHYLPTIADLTEVVPDATAVAIDIPIGLPDSGRRVADVEARRFLGPRRNSIFFTPVRAALEASPHHLATALSLRLTGSGISRQSYALAEKILEVEAWLPDAPQLTCEVHPEVSFALLTGSPAAASKKTWSGMVERRQALATVGIELEQVDVAAGRWAAIDDMLDAGVLAWSAGRLLEGVARSFPDPPEVDRSGRPVAIWG